MPNIPLMVIGKAEKSKVNLVNSENAKSDDNRSGSSQKQFDIISP